MIEEKNRFSKLLEQLMEEADVKNYMLARALQYDVSYISKWLNGKVIPSEKNHLRVVEGISEYIARQVSDEKLPAIMERYQVDNREELQRALYDHMEIEYAYVHDLQNTLNVSVAPPQRFFTEITLAEFVEKMHHPVLRRITSLDVIAAMDIFSMDREYRWHILSFEGERADSLHQYPDVHFSLVLNLDVDRLDIIYDTIFLINMLSNFSQVDFSIYTSYKASGKAVFAVRDDFAIGGMLDGKNHCLCVGIAEDAVNSNIFYDAVRNMINRELLLFRSTTVKEMLDNGEYIRSLLSPRPRWIIGHIDEHFLPTDVYQEVLQSFKDDPDADPAMFNESLFTSHSIARTLVDNTGVHLIFHENAVSQFVTNRELDFYDHKVVLTSDQVMRVMNHIEDMIKGNPKIKCQMILGKLVPDVKYYNIQNVFISDAYSYLRLSDGSTAGEGKYILVLNRPEVQAMFAKFFDTIWNESQQTVISDPIAISEYMNHMTARIKILSQFTNMGDNVTI